MKTTNASFPPPVASSLRIAAWVVLVVLVSDCGDSRQSDSQGGDDAAARSTSTVPFSFEVHRSACNQTFDVFTVGSGSLRTLRIVHGSDGSIDTTTLEIDGPVMNAECGDLDRDSLPELYVYTQSAGSGSYAGLYGLLFDRHGKQTITLPGLDKHLAAGYLGHDTLWVQDSVLVRRFPVYTEGDFNASASGGTRTLEYGLQRDRRGAPFLHCVRSSNNQ